MDMKVSSGINISSVILGVLPADGAAVSKSLRELDGVEVHALDVLTIESGDEDNTSNTFEMIRQMPGVISAALVFHQYESDPDEEA